MICQGTVFLFLATGSKSLLKPILFKTIIAKNRTTLSCCNKSLFSRYFVRQPYYKKNLVLEPPNVINDLLKVQHEL